jgi:chitinase
MWKVVILLACTVLTVFPGVAQTDDDETTDNQTAFSTRYYAPYVYMGGYPSPFLTQMAEEYGVRYFSLGFVLDGVRPCHARWMGSTPIDNFVLVNDLRTLRDLGGDVIVSFGGWGGTELALACLDAESLRAEYQRVIDLLDVTHLDFDIEGASIRDAESIDRRSEAIAMLQADAAEEGRELVIAFTLPVRTTGLTAAGLAVLESALAHGVDIDVVNIMTMNFGEGAPPDQMGQNTIDAAESLFVQLQEIYPEKTDEELWRMIGLTPQIGVNDIIDEIFTPEDAEIVTDFALEMGIRMLAMWSLSRDQECVSDVPVSRPNCSGVAQDTYDFSRIFNRFTE